MQAYLDTIKAKTGLGVDDFRHLAAEKDIAAYKDAMIWLKGDFGLGHGHANLIAQLVTKRDKILAPQTDKFAALFAAGKAHWRPVYDAIAERVAGFGPDVKMHANRSYVNLERDRHKFGIIQPSSAARLDIGIKLKGVAAHGDFTEAGSWNAMVTHRFSLTKDSALPDAVFDWLNRAYTNA